jgi:hypothetical protein
MKKLLDERDEKLKKQFAPPAGGRGQGLTAENLKKLLDERDDKRDKKLDERLKKIETDAKSTRSRHLPAAAGASAPRRSGVLAPPPDGSDGDPDGSGSDDDSADRSDASGSDSRSSESSGSASTASSSSGGRSRKSKRSRRAKDQVRGVATRGWTRKKIMSASKQRLIDVDVEDIYWIPERHADWIAAPGDIEERRTRAARLRAFHERELENGNRSLMGSLAFETSLLRTLSKALSDPSLPAATRIENALALVGCRQLTQLIAAKSGCKKALRYWTKRTSLSVADSQARRAMTSATTTTDNKKKGGRRWGRKAGKGGGKATK